MALSLKEKAEKRKAKNKARREKGDMKTKGEVAPKHQSRSKDSTKGGSGKFKSQKKYKRR